MTIDWSQMTWRTNSSSDAAGKPYPNEHSVELYKAPMTGPWPSDMAAYYDKLDDERGIPRARLCQGYKQEKIK